MVKTSPVPPGSEKELCEKFSDYFSVKISTIRNVLDSQPIHNVPCNPLIGSQLDSFELVTEANVLKITRKSPP